MAWRESPVVVDSGRKYYILKIILRSTPPCRGRQRGCRVAFSTQTGLNAYPLAELRQCRPDYALLRASARSSGQYCRDFRECARRQRASANACARNRSTTRAKRSGIWSGSGIALTRGEASELDHSNDGACGRNGYGRNRSPAADLTVGFVTSLSGPGASIGIPYGRGIAAAYEYASTVNGQKIKLIVLDDGSDPTTARPQRAQAGRGREGRRADGHLGRARDHRDGRRSATRPRCR